MDTWAFLLLALLTRGAASDLDLSILLEKSLRSGLGEIGRIEVEVLTPPSPRGDEPRTSPVNSQLREILVRLHQVDATLLPLQRFVPHPRERILKGRVERFVMEATEARLHGLMLTRLVITVTHLRFDLLYALKERDIRVTDVGEARLEATLTAQDLETYLQTRLPSLQEPHVELSPEKVQLTARADFGLLAASLELTGRPALRNAKEIHLLEPQLLLNHLPVPAAFAQTLLGKVNPLLNLDQLTGLPLPVVLDRLETRPGQLVLWGHLRTEEKPEPEAPPRW